MHTHRLLGFLVVLAALAFGAFASRSRSDDTKAAPSSSTAPVSTDGATSTGRIASVAQRTLPATRAEKLALDYLAERYSVLVAEGDKLTAEAKQVRGLPAESDLRWNPRARDGEWVLYAASAPVSSPR